MPELLQTYSIEQIVIFVVILAIAVKSIISFIDWAKARLDVAIKNKEKKDELKEEVNNIKNDMEDLKKLNEKQNELIDLLIASNKDEIKAWIIEKHHHFCYDLKYIDDYSLDCIERRYAHYVDEGGNSFVADLVEDIRALPVTCHLREEDHNEKK